MSTAQGKKTKDAPAPKKVTLQGLIQEFVAETVKRFPEMESRLVVLEMNGFTCYYAKGLGARFESEDDLLSFLALQEDVRACKRDEKASSFALRMQGDKCLIVLNNRFTPENVADLSLWDQASILFTLDHELAHLALKNGYGKIDETTQHDKVTRECIADAYALIRHYQRFGSDFSLFDADWFWRRVLGFAFSKHDKEPIHFTVPVLEALMQHKKQIDFSVLDQEQTLELARRFALAHVTPTAHLKELKSRLSPFRNAFYDSSKPSAAEHHEAAKILAGLALDETDYHVSKFLNHLLTIYFSGIMIDRDGKDVELTGGNWKEIGFKLYERQRLLDREGILAGMPRVKPKAANTNKPPR